jgi:hypothetical protein
MLQTLFRPGALAIAILLLAGCGVTFHPRVGGDQPPIPTDEGLAGPAPARVHGGAESGLMVEQLCRARGTPRGWVVVAYAIGGENCPPSRDAEDPYNVKLIERYADKRLGSTMIVCADQAVPRNWVRSGMPEGRADCPGARVSDGAPTVMAIRRVR